MKQLLSIVFFAMISSAVYAGFPVGRGKYLIVPSYNLYTAKGYWNEDGSYVDYTNSGRFASHYFGIYGGVGLTDNLDFIGNINYTLQRKKETNFSEQNSSLGDASFGLQYLLNSFDYYKFLTVTGSLIVPLYQNNPAKQPYTGFQQVGGEIKMSFAGTNRERMKNTYYDVNGGLRQYFSAEGPTQLFFDALFGVPLDDLNKLTFAMSGTQSNSSQNIFNPNNLFQTRSFSFFRLTAGYGRRIDQNYQLFINIFTDVSGKNTGKGGGGSISLVAKL
jgi:hypothetical protein